jgi:hypothetical protein
MEGHVALRVWRRAQAAALAAAAYTALAVIMFAGTWRDPFTRVVGYRGGDVQEMMWGLGWVPYALGHGHNPFFTQHLAYPEGVNLLWNTFAIPALALVLWPVTTTLGVIFAYNVATTLALALSAWTGFLLLRRYVARPLAAGLGGLLYGFSPYMVAQSLGHLHLTLIFLPPLILLLIDEIVRVQRRNPLLLGAALGLVSVVQFFISEEILAFTVLVSAVTLTLAAAIWPQRALGSWRPWVKAALAAAVVSVALLGWPIYFQLHGPQAIHGAQHPSDVFVNDLLGFWVPTGVQWINSPLAGAISSHFSGNGAEWNSYLGLPFSLLLVFVSIRWWRNGAVRLAALAGFVVAVLSFGVLLHVDGKVETHLPVFVVALPLLALPWVPARALVLTTFLAWAALWRMPLLDHVIPARIFLFGYLFAGLLLAIFVDVALRAGGRRAALGLGVAALALVPLLPYQPFFHTMPSQPAFFAPGGEVSRLPQGGVALVAPVANIEDAEPMQWQATAGMRYVMPEGYMFIPGPSGEVASIVPFTSTTQALFDIENGKLVQAHTQTFRNSVRADLTKLKVQTVVVGPMANEDQAVALLTWAMGRPPQYVQGVYVWWNVHNGT